MFRRSSNALSPLALTMFTGAFVAAPWTAGCSQGRGRQTPDDVGTTTAALSPSAGWLSRSYNSQRTSANVVETLLTPATVNSQSFGFRASMNGLPGGKAGVDDEVFAQPLYVPQVPGTRFGTQDVLYVCTANNTVYAFVATTGALIWSQNLNLGGRAVNVNDIPGHRNFDGNIGIIGTPVIDPATLTLYVVAHAVEQGASGPSYRLWALDLATGTQQKKSAPLSGAGYNTTDFPRYENQRPGLAESQGAIYVGFGSYGDSGSCFGQPPPPDGPSCPFHGVLSAFDATSLSLIAANTNPFVTTVNGASGAGIWQAGNAPAIDPSDGSVYVATGNGPNDETGNRGVSLIHLAPRTLGVLNAFVPTNPYQLTGDRDLSTGPVVAALPEGNLLLQGSKGTGYVFALQPSLVGWTTPLQQFQAVQPNAITTCGISDCPDASSANSEDFWDPFNIFNGVVWWGNPAGSNLGFMYVLGGTDNVRRYSFNAVAFDVAHASVSNSPAHGGVMTLSANGSTAGTGVLWVLNGSSPPTLYALDAEHVDRPVLWASTARAADNLGAFPGNTVIQNPPTVFNGHVYIGGGSPQAGTVSAYGRALAWTPVWHFPCRLTFFCNPVFRFPLHPFAVLPPAPPDPTFSVGWVVGGDGAVYYRSYQHRVWGTPTALTTANFAPSGANIAVAQQTATVNDAFFVANDGKVYVTSATNGGARQAPTALTSANFAPPGAPLATSTQGGVLGVALADVNGKLQVISWNALTHWSSPVAVTAANYTVPNAGVVVGQRASGELDTFSIGSDGALKYMAYSAGIWSGPYPLTLGNFAPPGAPVATAVDVHGFLNVLTVGNDGALSTKWDCTSLWCGTTALTSTGFAPPGAVVSAVNFNNKSLNVFVVDAKGTLDVLTNPGTGWQGPSAIAANIGQPGAATDVSVESSTQLDVFALSSSAASGVVESTNTGGGWSSPVELP